ncbi:serine/threonine-protein kinase ULK3 isoform X3 [Erpetoichthys calabaricus]|uniref:serine/threonine-protein kinase ULK3 isoform X3 n=1 Tax=Erpetoichthys calabaricus TaxID=27687 RepID=UPI002234AD54|nr:serine/threonine-protein kinase ULK3 isoform X3 [Erpetoichthys calabaricus]
MAAGFAPPKLAEFILTERLGSGTYAVVYKAYRKKDNREVVAVKVVSKKSLNKASMENLLTEIEILKTVKHPHIVQLKDFQWDSENIYLIMEFCSGGDLSRFIRSRRLLPEHVARRFLQQLASALKFLNERNISHLDLKPQNILLSGGTLKLADFGFAQYMSPWDERHVLRGSPLYMAPEMVCNRQYDARADLWSVGVILYEALFGHPPFASRSYAEIEEKIRSNRPIETMLVMEAVSKDQSGDYAAALSLYCQSLEHFVPAVHYETDAQRKEAIRKKVKQYISRAEDLKALVASNNKISFAQAKTTRDLLKEMSRGSPRLIAGLELASAAVAKEEEGDDGHDTLDLYQQSLGELLLMLAAEPVGRRRELLHGEIKCLMARAEYLKEQLKMRETQAEASMDRDPLSESVKSSCCVQ